MFEASGAVSFHTEWTCSGRSGEKKSGRFWVPYPHERLPNLSGRGCPLRRLKDTAVDPDIRRRLRLPVYDVSIPGPSHPVRLHPRERRRQRRRRRNGDHGSEITGSSAAQCSVDRLPGLAAAGRIAAGPGSYGGNGLPGLSGAAEPSGGGAGLHKVQRPVHVGEAGLQAPLDEAAGRHPHVAGDFELQRVQPIGGRAGRGRGADGAVPAHAAGAVDGRRGGGGGRRGPGRGRGRAHSLGRVQDLGLGDVAGADLDHGDHAGGVLGGPGRTSDAATGRQHRHGRRRCP